MIPQAHQIPRIQAIRPSMQAKSCTIFPLAFSKMEAIVAPKEQESHRHKFQAAQILSDRGKVEINYPWLEGDFEKITLVSRNGVTFEKEIDVASVTPTFNSFYLKTFALLGIYVGVIPVLLGLLWLPFLRMLKERWYSFLLALTVGLLVFLGFDALAESFDL